jgi:phosphopantothenoylcysteine synthetase/decarboxylase
MRTNDIIKEIQRLPVQKRIYVIEKTIQSIRKQEDAKLLKKAADALLVDYKSDKELTAFTNIDFADFYEAK